MGNPVRFYSVTPEEFENLLRQMERGSDGVEEKKERKPQVNHIDENKENNNVDER